MYKLVKIELKKPMKCIKETLFRIKIYFLNRFQITQFDVQLELSRHV